MLQRFARLSLSILIPLACFLSTGPTPNARARGWQPQRTWVFIVGTLKWQHADMFDSFPQTNRRDKQLADYFRKQGVPDSQLIYLQDEQATTRRVKNAFSEMLSRTRE